MAIVMSSPPGVPLPVIRALRKVGKDLRAARLRRRIPLKILAERTSMSRTTLAKIEKGDPTVSLGNCAAVLFSLGLVDRLADLADPREDAVGMALEEEQLPKRIRLSRKKKE
jgi:transcriptional regulator with XRE-family HTH domain